MSSSGDHPVELLGRMLSALVDAARRLSATGGGRGEWFRMGADIPDGMGDGLGIVRADEEQADDWACHDLELQDLVLMLLHGAVETSASLERMRQLVSLAPDPASAALIDDAIRIMTDARTNLLHSVDRVAEDPPHA